LAKLPLKVFFIDVEDTFPAHSAMKKRGRTDDLHLDRTDAEDLTRE
jgi:hypothetical protein